LKLRTKVIEGLKQTGINSVFHYVPLHSSPAGQRFGRGHGVMTNTDELSKRLLRLPFWLGVEEQITYISKSLSTHLMQVF
jgi:dTDP-4-amino-4,6-dideoxygalactose transaminase